MTEQEKESTIQDTELVDNLDEFADATKAFELQIADLQDKLLRANAENENMRRRYEKQIDETREYSVSGLCRDLISVMDNLSRALEYKPSDVNVGMQNVVAGVEMTKTELASIFTKYGIEEILPVAGGKFDYNTHHAIAQVVDDTHPQGTVLELMQVGYKIKDRLLRPAAVSVTKKSE